MSHNPNNPYGGGPYGGNPFGAGGGQPVQHRSDCREPLRNPCENPCGRDDDEDVVGELLDSGSGGDGGSGGGEGWGGGRGGGRGEGRGGDGPFGGGSGGSGGSGSSSQGGSSGNSGSGNSGGGDGCGCMPGKGGGGGGGGRGGSGGGGDGCGGCDPCLLRTALLLPFVVLWAALRAVVGRPLPSKQPVSYTDRTLPDGHAARTMFRAVRWYRLTVSPRRAEPVCRYTPSCSTYAATSLREHGAWRGGRLALRRLSRCNVRHPGGYDPVP